MAQQLRFRTLFAGTAIAALALTGCVQSTDDEGGDDSSSSSEESSAPESSAPEETTEASEESAESTDEESSDDESASEDESASDDASASEDESSDSSSSSAASGEAPEDLSDSDLLSSLSTQINGAQLMAITADQLASTGTDPEEDLLEAFGEDFAVSPASCQDPFLNALLGGVHDTDGVLAVDQEGSLMVSAETFDDAAAAEDALQADRDAADGCGEVEVTADGTSGSAELSTSDLEVEGADSAYEATVENEGESYSTAGMAYGNTVIMVVDTGQYEGDPAPDNAALLEEVATALSEG
ncbi:MULTISPECIES: hypothetical protein [Kocuria]|uniref:Prokaryotic membrane lipoprotein lipid attachment site profile n=1 Tax=Kocuria palustris PEL TaxID=1236550 RepID=M2YDW1_9MICC|nr:hypothetical protein [Kocuria palustris]EME36799.1 hypothetical protein C884_02406 [Kocuria palustris PEL]KUG51353.1 hypothetical protein AVL60_10885 [Kocuria palustris]